MQYRFGVERQGLERLIRSLWVRDPNQFYFVELMLADHAAGIATSGPGFGSKARGVGGPAQGQLFRVQDFIAHLIGERDFTR